MQVPEITYLHLAIAFACVLPTLWILYYWRLRAGHAAYALSRMFIQLTIIGYFLAFIFQTSHLLVIVAILSVMVLASSWIALGSVENIRRQHYWHALIAIFVSGTLMLLIITQGVLTIDPWYHPRFVIPLAGMIYANAMNSVSLAAERMISEMQRVKNYEQARATAFQAAMIPVTNSLFAVGLVSLPGMMTGQILSGVEPFVAAKYQIVVMCMIFGSAGLAAAIFLLLAKKNFDDTSGISA